jgi:hypothetical protein
MLTCSVLLSAAVAGVLKVVAVITSIKLVITAINPKTNAFHLS